MNSFQTIGKPIVVASHPRSGTHLTIDLLRRQFQPCRSWKKPGEPLDRLYFALESFAPSPPLKEATAIEILRRAPRPLIKTHADPQFHYLQASKPDWVQWLKTHSDFVYVVRDGRAVMCSLHLFMQSYDPTTRCSLSEFMRQNTQGRSRVAHWANHVRQWMALPHVTVLRFEDVVRQTQDTLDVLGSALNLSPMYVHPLLPAPIKSLWHGRWVRLTQMRPESTAIIGFYDKQAVQKWKTAFDERDRHFFHQEAGDLLMELGYEDSDDWVNAPIAPSSVSAP